MNPIQRLINQLLLGRWCCIAKQVYLIRVALAIQRRVIFVHKRRHGPGRPNVVIHQPQDLQLLRGHINAQDVALAHQVVKIHALGAHVDQALNGHLQVGRDVQVVQIAACDPRTGISNHPSRPNQGRGQIGRRIIGGLD